jgi:hypothetical protein
MHLYWGPTRLRAHGSLSTRLCCGVKHGKNIGSCTKYLNPKTAILTDYLFLNFHYVGSVTIDLDKVENVRIAVGNSAICHSIPEIYSTSSLVSSILNFASRPTSDSVGRITIGSGMVENVGIKPLEFRRYVIPFLRYSLLPVYSPSF